MKLPCCLCVYLCVALNFFVPCGVRLVSKESRRLILPRTSCFLYLCSDEILVTYLVTIQWVCNGNQMYCTLTARDYKLKSL
jgi:hypothetical protein